MVYETCNDFLQAFCMGKFAVLVENRDDADFLIEKVADSCYASSYTIGSLNNFRNGKWPNTERANPPVYLSVYKDDFGWMPGRSEADRIYSEAFFEKSRMDVVYFDGVFFEDGSESEVERLAEELFGTILSA